MKKKSILLAATAVMLVCAMSIGGMLAYFTDTDTKENTFTVGNVKIQINEEFEQGSIANPGVAVDKNPTIENTGKNAAYVRMKVVFSDGQAWIDALNDKYPNNTFYLHDIFDGVDTTNWGAVPLMGNPNFAKGGLYDEDTDTITIIYQYSHVLEPDESTTARFTSVTMPELFDNEDIARFSDDGEPGFTVTVIGEAIQAEGFESAGAAFAALDKYGALPAVEETAEPTEPVEP